MIDKLKCAGIPIAVYYPLALNEEPAYKYSENHEETSFALKRAELVHSLPMSPDVSQQDKEWVCTALKECSNRIFKGTYCINEKL